jgi:hypothetical protein
MATLIPTSGFIRQIAPHNGVAFTLQELQGFVGGYLESLRAPDGRIVFLNEDGKRLQLPVNAAASYLLRPMLLAGDVIVGDVVLCTAVEAGEDDADEVEL